ncbi:hypothetical protein B0H14DRAFT_3508719 [Mycena olivaceomarginata]|nr:hypothetical protein B0H14DRAFT_3508719 [Mycena olivaceomarginata]
MSRPDTITCPPTCSSAEERPSHGHHTAGELPLSRHHTAHPSVTGDQQPLRHNTTLASTSRTPRGWARFPTGSPPDASSLGGDLPMARVCGSRISISAVTR